MCAFSCPRQCTSNANFVSIVIDTKNTARSALADLVARSRVVDLWVALFVGDRVVEAHDAETLVEPFDRDRVVGTADVRVGAGALDGQLVVVAADVDGFAISAIDFGCRSDRSVVDGVADLDLSARTAHGRGRTVGVAALRAAAGQSDDGDGRGHTDQYRHVRAHGSSLPVVYDDSRGDHAGTRSIRFIIPSSRPRSQTTGSPFL